MRTLKLTLAYDGTRFVGWQRQASGDSIQGLLEDVLARIEGAGVTVAGAGRTDAGVHALGQVASVQLTCTHDADTLRRALNAQLPPGIRVQAVEDASSDFHARFSARSKTYAYVVRQAGACSPFTRAYEWHVTDPLDRKAMMRAASTLVGRHDFAAFQSTGTTTSTTVRTITKSEFVLASARLAPFAALQTNAASGMDCVEDHGPDSGCQLVYTIAGDGFLRHMVRAIIGTLVEIGRGSRRVESISELLAGAPRGQAGVTAPAHGLFLVRVDYD